MSDKVITGAPVAVEIPADILAELEGSKQEGHYNEYPWQPWQDAVIRKYGDQPYQQHGITKQRVCDILGSRGMRRPSETTVRKRYRELTREDT